MIKHNIDDSYYLQETLINMIDYALNQFFETRYQLVLTMKELYMQGGGLNNLEDFFIHLKLSDNEIERLTEKINYKFNIEISDIFYNEVLNINKFINRNLYESLQYMKENMIEMGNTEKIAKAGTMFINQSIYIMIDDYFKGNVLGNIFQQYNYGDNLLNHYGLEKQQHLHSDLFKEQLLGLLINFKIELRNILVKSVLLEINIIYNNNKCTSVA